MTDARLLLELRLLEQRLPALVRQAVEDALQTRLDPSQRRTVMLLAEMHGDGPAFETRHLWEQLQIDVGPRAELRQELAEQEAVDPQSVGQLLLAIARAGGRSGDWRLVRHDGRGSRAKWSVQRAAKG